MTLYQHYKNAVLLPSLLLTGGFILYALIYVIFDLGKDYKSEWMTANSFLLPTILTVIINCVIVGILSAAIFLNTIPRIARSSFLSFLAWFLFPSVWIGYLLFKAWSTSDKYMDHSSLFFLLINTLPFLISLFLGFKKFRRETGKMV